ncbi:radical SAM protein [Thermoanaerobacter thermocopriae]|uniref:radical SAM protein n=1 Tax=Thermoanaerobacter thermocopriae TaxID=29350 RepID=UPI0006D18683|nr:radical SAM protein [Thermoanaerobacter thermocopriae]
MVGSLRHYQIKELELDDIKKLAEQMEKYEIFKIILNGGEPTVRKDFFKILEIFNKHKIPIELVTNGINLSKEKIEIMNSYHVVGYSLSIEGSNSETHDLSGERGHLKRLFLQFQI